MISLHWRGAISPTARMNSLTNVGWIIRGSIATFQTQPRASRTYWTCGRSSWFPELGLRGFVRSRRRRRSLGHGKANLREEFFLQECNLSTEPSADCNDCIPPGPGQVSDRGLGPSWDASASHGQSEKLTVRTPLSYEPKLAVHNIFPLPIKAKSESQRQLPTNSATDH